MGTEIPNKENLCFSCSREFCDDRNDIDSPNTYVAKCWKYELNGITPPKEGE